MTSVTRIESMIRTVTLHMGNIMVKVQRQEEQMGVK